MKSEKVFLLCVEKERLFAHTLANQGRVILDCEVDLPIVILLHGVYGSAWSWSFSGSAHLIAQDLIDRKIIQPMVLVMPSDGLWGDGSAFAKQGTLDFENWIVLDTIAAAKELIPQVKSST